MWKIHMEIFGSQETQNIQTSLLKEEQSWKMQIPQIPKLTRKLW